MQSGSVVSNVGNVNSADAESKAGVTLKADEDHIHCPISLQIMRHPILASDGRHYELAQLLDSIKRQGLISPVNRDPLTSVLYDLGLQASLEKTFVDGDRYPNYDRAAGMGELDALFQHQRFLQLRQLEVYQEEKLRVIEQVQVRRQAEVLQQIRQRPRAAPMGDVHINIDEMPDGEAEDLQIEGLQLGLAERNAIVNARLAAQVLQAEDAVLHLLRRIPIRNVGRFFAIYIFATLLLDAGYELMHSGPHDSSAAHLQDDIGHVAPVGILVAAADVALRRFSQNANGLFNQVRVAKNYFAGWARQVEPGEGDDMGAYHVRPHVL
jgi:hypothetical protein